MESIEDHWEDKLEKALMYLSQKQIYQQVSLEIYHETFYKNVFMSKAC